MKHFPFEQYIANLSIDCVIFGYEKRELKVLLGKVKVVEDVWNLPGGHILKTESVDDAAARILHERTQLKDLYLKQFKVFGQEQRILNSLYREDVRTDLAQRYDQATVDWITDRFVSIGYYALVDISKVQVQHSEIDAYFDWCSVHQIPMMMHDHADILEDALLALRQNFDQDFIAHNLLPETFTMKDLQNVYELVFDRKFPMNNFQKKMLDLNMLERLEKKFTGAQHKAPYVYRIVNCEL